MSHAEEFSEGLAQFKKDGKIGFIDKQDNVVIEPQYKRASEFRFGLARVTIDSESVVIDKTGKVVWTHEIVND